MLDGDPEKWIIKLISDQSGITPDRISPESRLKHDLGIDGDDAAELFELYSEAFGVDLTGIQWSKYFRDEPHWLNFWQWIPGLRGSKREPIRVRDLVEAARRKKWKEPG